MTEWSLVGKKKVLKGIANVDLWLELVEASAIHIVSWAWVRGHSGNEFNERVDEIAREQAALLFICKNFEDSLKCPLFNCAWFLSSTRTILH